MEFKRFAELLEIGHVTAKQMLLDWAKAGKLPTGTEGEISADRIKKRGQSARRNSVRLPPPALELSTQSLQLTNSSPIHRFERLSPCYV